MLSNSAILIRTTRLTETSLIVHWLSKDEGLVKTVAQGALRPKSAFAGKLDLFFSAEIGVARARKGELHVLRELVIFNWREGLRRSYLSTLMAAYFCQLAEAVLEPGHGDEQLYDLLLRGLDHLNVENASLRALHHFEKQLAQILGVYSGGRGADSLVAYLGKLPNTRGQIIKVLGDG